MTTFRYTWTKNHPPFYEQLAHSRLLANRYKYKATNFSKYISLFISLHLPFVHLANHHPPNIFIYLVTYLPSVFVSIDLSISLSILDLAISFCCILLYLQSPYQSFVYQSNLVNLSICLESMYLSIVTLSLYLSLNSLSSSIHLSVSTLPSHLSSYVQSRPHLCTYLRLHQHKSSRAPYTEGISKCRYSVRIYESCDFLSLQDWQHNFREKKTNKIEANSWQTLESEKKRRVIFPRSCVNSAFLPKRVSRMSSTTRSAKEWGASITLSAASRSISPGGERKEEDDRTREGDDFYCSFSPLFYGGEKLLVKESGCPRYRWCVIHCPGAGRARGTEPGAFSPSNVFEPTLNRGGWSSGEPPPLTWTNKLGLFHLRVGDPALSVVTLPMLRFFQTQLRQHTVTGCRTNTRISEFSSCPNARYGLVQQYTCWESLARKRVRVERNISSTGGRLSRRTRRISSDDGSQSWLITRTRSLELLRTGAACLSYLIRIRHRAQLPLLLKCDILPLLWREEESAGAPEMYSENAREREQR